jgi:hypothetical protein
VPKAAAVRSVDAYLALVKKIVVKVSRHLNAVALIGK